MAPLSLINLLAFHRGWTLGVNRTNNERCVYPEYVEVTTVCFATCSTTGIPVLIVVKGDFGAKARIDPGLREGAE
jgi:hypothetical protein